MNKILNRRKFIKLGILSSIGAWLIQLMPNSLAKVFAATNKQGNTDIKYVRQIITADPATNRTIMWESSKHHNIVKVILQPALNNGASVSENTNSLNTAANTTTVMATSKEIVYAEEEPAFIHTARIIGLNPATEYKYQIIQDNSTSAWFSINTNTSRPNDSLSSTSQANDNSFTALIFPDSQCSDGYRTWKYVAQSAYNQHPDAILAINMGDLTDNGEAGYQWRQWFDGIAGIWENIPFAPVMGNHEAYSLDWKYCLPAAFIQYFSLPSNGSSKLHNYYYSFDLGPVHFIVLNTQMEELNSFLPDMVDSELAWLEADAAASSKKWQIVLMHKDVINYDNLDSTEPLADIDIIGKTFMPYFDRLNIDVVLTAHQHTYRRHNHIYNFNPSPNKGPVYIDTGVAGNVRYTVPRTKRFDQVMAPQPETDNYLTLKANDASLEFTCYYPNGAVIDQYTLKK